MDVPKYTLVEHLSELRKRLIYCIATFAFCSIVSWPFVPQLIKLISSPAGNLVFIHPTEAFFTYMKLAFWIGFFLSLPVTIFNIWKFIGSALLPSENKYLILFVPFSLILFLAGSSFGFFIVIPFAIKFLLGFGAGWATPMLSINDYISFVGSLLLAFGLSFEMPIVILFLTKLKIVSAKTLSSYRRHAILLIFIAAAILTPTPDAFTQLLLAGTLIILYELSVLMSRII